MTTDRDAGPRRPTSRSTCASPAGRATSRSRAICIGSSTRCADPVVAEGQRRAGAARARQGLRRRSRRDVAAPATSSTSTCRCRSAASSRTTRVDGRPRAASPCSAARSSTPPSGPTTRTATCATCAARHAALVGRVPARRCSNGVTVDHRHGLSASRTTRPAGVTRTEQPFTAIPYYAWANRGRGQMLVWIPRVEAVGPPDAVADGRHDEHGVGVGQEPPQPEDDQRRRGPGLVDRLGVATSTGGRPRARPSGSSTRSQKPATVSEVEVYWFDDTGQRRGPRARVVARRSTATATRGSRSRPRAPYGVERDRYNRVALHAGDDDRAAPRGDDAAEVVGRPAGVEGEVVRPSRRSASRTSPARRACRSARSTARCTTSRASTRPRGGACSQRPASLGYRPNLAARHLKSRTTLRVSVHLPREIALFWDSLRDGIREAAAPFEPTLQVEFRSHPRLGEGDVDAGRAGARQRRERAHRRARRPGRARALHRAARPTGTSRSSASSPTRRAPSASRRSRPIRSPSARWRASCSRASCPAAATSRSSPGGSAREDHAEKLRGFDSSVDAVGRGVRRGVGRRGARRRAAWATGAR